MARAFLDTNIFIGFIEKRQESVLVHLKPHIVFISPLSVHILAYVYKYKIPKEELLKSLEQFMIISFNEHIMNNALLGPTSDFEDNVQLHSAAQEECDIFLTNDKKLLGMRFFGKTKITDDVAEKN